MSPQTVLSHVQRKVPETIVKSAIMDNVAYSCNLCSMIQNVRNRRFKSLKHPKHFLKLVRHQVKSGERRCRDQLYCLCLCRRCYYDSRGICCVRRCCAPTAFSYYEKIRSTRNVVTDCSRCLGRNAKKQKTHPVVNLL